MYEYIKGTITDITTTYIVVENNGIGYLINISLGTYNLIERNKEQKLYIHSIIKEDSNIFFGFFDKQERSIFRLLISVSGVGANTARMLLSVFSPQELINIISFSDSRALEKVKGIGTKSAQRIIIDLKDKVSLLEKSENNSLIPITESYKSKQESILALEALGFSRKNVEKIVEDLINADKNILTEDIVKQSLKKLTN